jgi:asparagine synthase (glutamine-hydrolysing)
MHRVLGLRWKPGDHASRQMIEDAIARLKQGAGWREVSHTRGFRLFVTETARDVDPIILPDGAGLVLGAFFQRTEAGHRAKRQVQTDELRAWCETDGAALAASCWGNYLALIVDARGDRILVARDPMGGRPCYVVRLDHKAQIIFTDLADLAAIHQLPEIDAQFIGWFLTQPRLVSERTGLRGVREILAGECYAIGVDGAEAHLMWQPPRPSSDMIAAPVGEIAQDLRACVCAAAAAYAGVNIPILHRLSGGLDSSIALTALVAAAPEAPLRCINEFTVDLGEGDEREAARASARRLGVELIEMGYRSTDLRYDALLDMPLSAKPSITQMSFADTQLVAHGDFQSATLVTSGQGGDQVFYRSNALCTVADAVRDGLSLKRVLATALDAARVSRRSIWPALQMALEYGYLRHAEAYVRDVLRAAASGEEKGLVEQVVEEAMGDPWVREGLKAGPGVGMRALHLADLQYYHAPSVITAYAIPAPVLTAQPVVEYCCRIPTYRTIEGGRDRAIARLAFAVDLPASAVARHRKGDTTRFFVQVAEHNADFICDVLGNGELAQMGLFDPKRLDQKPKSAAFDFSQELVAEIWLRRIKAARLAFAALAASAHSDPGQTDLGSHDPGARNRSMPLHASAPLRADCDAI